LLQRWPAFEQAAAVRACALGGQLLRKRRHVTLSLFFAYPLQYAAQNLWVSSSPLQLCTAAAAAAPSHRSQKSALLLPDNLQH